MDHTKLTMTLLFYYLYAGYSQSYTWSKPCFLGIQCCNNL